MKTLLAKLSFILLFLLTCHCRNANQQSIEKTIPDSAGPLSKYLDSLPDSARQVALLKWKEAQAEESDLNERLGEKIDTIGIAVSVKNKKELEEWPEGVIHWISLDTPQTNIDYLRNPNKIVLPYNKVELVIDYPVDKPVFFDLTSPGKGFTRKALVLAISKKYHEMYEEEERTSRIKTTPVAERKGMYNRNTTQGKYGIWGHDLADLVLDYIEVYRNGDGVIFLRLGIDS